MKKNIYIHGSFMTDNYGDFLLFYVAKKICDKYSNKANIYSSDVDTSYDRYCKLERKSKLYSIFKSNIVIFAGGGYFGEPDKRKIYWNIRCIWKHLLPAYIISKRKIPYAIIGVETGPLSCKLSRFLLKKVCNNATIISVRNEESKEFLNTLGIKRNVEMNPDWIMGINKDLLLEKTEKENLNIDKKYKKIFLHLTTHNNNGKENVIRDLIKYQKENKNIFYIIGCDQKRETQEKRSVELLQRLEKDRCILKKYEGPWKLSYLLNYSDAVITDKLHVGIVATKLNKEVISVASHTKSIKFYRLIGRDEWSTHITKVKLGETYEKLNKLTFNGVENNNEFFEKAKENERLLNKFLRDNL